MQLSLTNPVIPPTPSTPPSVAQIQLLEATYSFTNATINLVWNELDAGGAQIQSRREMLTPEQTIAFFATPVGGAPDLQTLFVEAFTAAVELFYGPATVLPPPAPDAPPAP
jgi:hypothetical protein